MSFKRLLKAAVKLEFALGGAEVGSGFVIGVATSQSRVRCSFMGDNLWFLEYPSRLMSYNTP